MPIKCFDHADEDHPLAKLKEEFDKQTEGVFDEEKQREIGKKIVMDYHKELHGKMNEIRDISGMKQDKKYVAPVDNSKAINEIKADYADKIIGHEPPEPPTTGGEPKSASPSEDPELTKVANAINDARIKGKFGTEALDKVMGKLQDTDTKSIYGKVKSKIEAGTLSPKDIRDRILTTKTGSKEDQAALLYDLADLKGKEFEMIKEINATDDPKKMKSIQDQMLANQNEQMDNALANRLIGREASTVLNIRKLWVNREKSVVDLMEEYKASKGIKTLTPEQETEVKRKYGEINDARNKVKITREELDKVLNENTALKARAAKMEELVKGATARKKADRAIKTTEAIQKSTARVDAAKANLRKLGGQLNAGFDPRIAIEIGKIAAEKVYQGVVRFNELVSNVYDDVKDILPHFTREDVINHLLTEKGANGELQPSSIADRYKAAEMLAKNSDANLREKSEAYAAAQKDVALKQFQWDKDRRMDIMDNRPMATRIIDNILRWQRFAVLSYPTTVVKLGAVVAHGLLLKPLKVGIQAMISNTLGRLGDLRKHQSIWGDPHFSSLGKYYSAFVRNFALSNLKEQFSGIDTKEMLYGDGMRYDEFNAGRGLLEMPGRAHGYIKSFIKNPEFAFAHEQQLIYHLTQMKDIQEKLQEPGLTKEAKEKLQDEFDQHDITNEDTMERINKLALEHGKWAILMNDNKFVEKFRNWTNNAGITGAFIKSELPIIKIPANYVSRAFMTKYGLIQSILGKRDFGSKNMETIVPNIFKIIKNGTSSLSEEQANLLGKSLAAGTMGAGFFALGYMGHKHIKENHDGSAEIMGVHVSKNLLHSPEFESIYSGAMTKNRFQQAKRKDTEAWIKSFAHADMDIASKNPFMSMLAYGFTGMAAGALLSNKDSDKKDLTIKKAIGKKIADMLVPGFIKQPAGWMDTGKPGIHPMGNPVKREPGGGIGHTILQELELDLPVLRKNVPKAKK